MNTLTINNITNTASFKAQKTATIKPLIRGLTDSIDIYELNKSDNNFLKKLAQQVKFKELLPKMNISLIKRWQQIFDYCVTKAQEHGYKTAIAVSKEKLCGIMTTCITDNKNCCIEGISTIPDKDGNKTPFIGQALFLYLFNKENSEQIKGYTLEAVTDGPVNVIKKYKDLGFKEGNTITGRLSADDTDHIYMKMFCNKYTSENKCKDMKKNFMIEKESESEQIDLSKFLN